MQHNVTTSLLKPYILCLVCFTLQNYMVFAADVPFPYDTKAVKVANALKPIVDLVDAITKPGAPQNKQDCEDYKMRVRIFMCCVVEPEYVDVGDESRKLQQDFFARPETPRSKESVRIFKEYNERLGVFYYQKGLGKKFASEQGLSGAFQVIADTCSVQ